MKLHYVLGMSVMAIGMLASCGGNGDHADENAETTDSVEVKEPVVETFNYTVDTAATVVKWKGYEGIDMEEPEFHAGTVKALNGTVEVTSTDGELAVTNATLTVDMNSIATDEGIAKLEGHLGNEDFFNINEFATTEFTFDKYEEGVVYGKISVVGNEYPVEAPVTLEQTEEGLTVTSEPFRVDFSNLPFFVRDAEAPAEEQHDPKVEFVLDVKAVK